MTLPQPLRTRIAPTPSGFLHIGNAFSFLLTWLVARKTGGWLQLRIDDADNMRTRAEYLHDIFESLDWLGIDYDTGSNDMSDFRENYTQTRKTDLYLTFLNELIIQNKIYACDCSRSQIKKKSYLGKYDNHCRERKLSLNTENAALRIKMPTQQTVQIYELAHPHDAITIPEDFIVRRKDKIIAYQVISVVEDVSAHINCIVRGNDLVDSSIKQLFLAKALRQVDFGEIVFWHHPLIVNDVGLKLAKSAGDASLLQMRENGIHQSVIYRAVADFLQIEVSKNPSLSELLERFEIQKIYSTSNENIRLSSLYEKIL